MKTPILKRRGGLGRWATQKGRQFFPDQSTTRKRQKRVSDKPTTDKSRQPTSTGGPAQRASQPTYEKLLIEALKSKLPQNEGCKI